MAGSSDGRGFLFGVIACVAGYGGYHAWRWLADLRMRHRVLAFRARVEAEEPRVFTLSLAEARQRALRVLRESGRWQLEPYEGQPPAGVSALAPSLRELLLQWYEIGLIRGNVSLMYRDDIDLADDYLPLPPDSRHPVPVSNSVDDDGRLFTDPGDERIHEFVLDSARWVRGGYRVRGHYRCYPSVWHWILMKDIEVSIRRAG